ncbi:hypothetical protein KFK09_006171 [Dendrobium nobile]|uniref:Uncharacterized protein n=1 Tax=Dendrobium nobile TaxID=94219 RepID=A0A8T3BN69_DENNO|nr:hypothetical protein KFK09_006171 [Dendrobium nobile]
MEKEASVWRGVSWSAMLQVISSFLASFSITRFGSRALYRALVNRKVFLER